MSGLNVEKSHSSNKESFSINKYKVAAGLTLTIAGIAIAILGGTTDWLIPTGLSSHGFEATVIYAVFGTTAAVVGLGLFARAISGPPIQPPKGNL
jgi:hypothetical protein